MILEVPFGELLLESGPSSEAVLRADLAPLAVSILVGAFLLLALLFLPRFLNLVPLLFDSLFRARGSSTLENSVRYGIDRRLLAALLLIPAILVMYHYRLYDPSFLSDWTPFLRLAGIAGIFLGYLLFRYILYRLLMPRRRADSYRLARNTALTYFIVLVLLVLVSLGVLVLFGAGEETIGLVILIESTLVYAAFFLRRAQILALSCNPLRTFLYFCGLEILPTAAWLLSAVLL